MQIGTESQFDANEDQMGDAEWQPKSHADRELQLSVDDGELQRQRGCPIVEGSMAKLSERIEALESRLRELKHRQQRVEARKRSLQGQRERREDTRRKILVGALVLTQVERGDYSREQLRKALDAFLTRPGDRALFSLGSSATRSSGRPGGCPS